MENKAATRKELIGDLADLRQQFTEKSQSETKNSLRALQASEIRYRRLFETAQDGILILNAETGQIDDVNPYLIDMLHYSHEEFVGKKLWEVSPFKDTILNLVAFEELQDKGYIRYKDLPLETKEGKPVAVEFVSNIYKANGDKVIQCNIRNITERKRSEKVLKESENQYRLLADNVIDVIFVLDMNLHYTYVSPSVKMLMGYEPEELLNQPAIQTMTLSSWDLATKTISEVIELEEFKHSEISPSRTVQLELKRKDGTTVWAEVKASFIRDENQQATGILGMTRDITERRQAEEQLKKSEERYRSIFENAQEGIYRSTPDGKVIMANQAMAKMFGYESPEEMITGITDVARQHYVNPEDRRKLEERIEEHGFIKGYEAQSYRKDRSIIWISRTMHAVRDEKGQIIYYDGIIEDISNRKQKDERIRKVLGSTVQAIAVTVETRDPYTAGHQRRVADLARAIATEMNLSADQIDGIRMAATIHDLGKISVPAEILSKPTKLTNIELRLIKTHSQSGYDILQDIDFPWPVARTVLEHHERMNGSGYPNGLTGDNILLESRILAVADVVESMASHRPYRSALGIKAALEEIENNRGTLYDHNVTNACLRLFQEKGYQLQVLNGNPHSNSESTVVD